MGRPWPFYDDKKHRWDKFEARTVNMALRAGFPEDEVAQMLHHSLPGDAVIYLDRMNAGDMNLKDMLWHLDLQNEDHRPRDGTDSARSVLAW